MELRSGNTVGSTDEDDVEVRYYDGEVGRVPKSFIHETVYWHLHPDERDGPFQLRWVHFMYQLMKARKIERPTGFRRAVCAIMCNHAIRNCTDQCPYCNMFRLEMPRCRFANSCRVCEIFWLKRLRKVRGNVIIEGEPWHFCKLYKRWRRGNYE